MAALTSRMEEILKRAYEDLDRFYDSYGESKKGLNKKEKERDPEVSLLDEIAYPFYAPPPPKPPASPVDEEPFFPVFPRKSSFLPTKRGPVPPIPTQEPKQEPEVVPGEYTLEVLRGMQAKSLLSLIKEKTGQELNISTKSKRCIVNRAAEALGLITLRNAPPIKITHPSIIKESHVPLETMSSSSIIKLVEEKTGVKITICVKSKKNVIKHAMKILKEHNISGY